MNKKPFVYCFKKLMMWRGSIKNFKEYQDLTEQDKKLLDNIIHSFSVEDVEECSLTFTEDDIKWI